MNDLATLIISGLALVTSVIAALFTLRLQRFDSQRSTREHLHKIVSDLITLYSENLVLWMTPAEQRDGLYYGRSSTITHRAVALTRQAVYLIKQEPDLVTDVEYGTVAQGLSLAGDYPLAKEHWRKAIDRSPSEFYRILNTRAYAGFLFGQGEHEAGRASYQQALNLVRNGDDFEKYTNGYTYQHWMGSEAQERFSEEAEKYYRMARRTFELIASPTLRFNSLAGLESAHMAQLAAQAGAAARMGPDAGG